VDGKSRADIQFLEGGDTLFSPFRKALLPPGASEKWFQWASLEDGSVYLRWSKLFEFLVSPDGRRIVGRPLSGNSGEAFQAYLLNQVLSFSLIRRGIEPLHSTAVLVEDGAFALLGNSGYGKSTLAASFVSAGYPLLTDDLLVLSESRRGILAYPGPRRIKLMPEAARSLMVGSASGIPMNPLTRKLIIPLKGIGRPQAPVPLKAIYVLPYPRPRSPRRTISVRRLTPRQAFLALMRNVFNTAVVDPDRLTRQFRLISVLASQVPVKALSYPRTFKILPDLRAAILSDLHRLRRSAGEGDQ
jgi:hypothetical protein